MIANVVGDGCVVRLYDKRTGGLEAAAVAHRDRERRRALESLIGGPALSPELGWAADAYRRNVAFRLRDDAAVEAMGAGACPEGVHAAIAAPFRLEGRAAGVVLALRDSGGFGYSPSEAQIVQELAVAPGAAPGTRSAAAGLGTAARILEHAPGAVWVTDPAGVTTYVNHAACELAGAPSSILLGTRIGDFFGGAPLTAGTEPADQRLERFDGSTAWVSVVAAPLLGDDGRPLGVVRTLTDVGDRRSVEVEARMTAAAYGSIAELTEMALAGGEFALLADEAVGLVADLLGAEYVSLGEIGADRETIVPRAVHGWPREVIGACFPLPELSGGRLCLDENVPVVIRDYRALDRLETGDLVESALIRSAFFVRVADGAAVLSAHSPRTEAFAREDLSAVRLLTSVLGARWEPRIARLAAVG